MIVAVAGCVAQAEGAEILRRAKSVDIVVGPQSYHRLPGLVGGGGARRTPVETEFPAESKFDHLPRPGAQSVSAFLSVQEGCDKFCSFCVVPYTRGAEFSRPAAAVLEEAQTPGRRRRARDHAARPERQRLSRRGARRRRMGLGRLIRELAKIPGLLAAALHHLASRGHGRRSDAAHGEEEKLMPLSPPAGAVGLGPRARGDEPPPHAPMITAA